MRFARVMTDLGPLALLALIPLAAGAALGASGWPAVPARVEVDTSDMQVQNGRAVLYVGDTIRLVAKAYDTRGARVTGPRIRWETILVPNGQPFTGKVSAGRFVAAGRLYGAQFGFVYGRVQWLTTAGALTASRPFTYPVLTRASGPNAVASIGVDVPAMEPWAASLEAAANSRRGMVANGGTLWNIYTIRADGSRLGSPYWCQQIVAGDAARVLADTLVAINVNHGRPVGYEKAPAWCIPRGVAVHVVADDWATVVHRRPAVDEFAP